MDYEADLELILLAVFSNLVLQQRILRIEFNDHLSNFLIT